jgi:hypothetical protein
MSDRSEPSGARLVAAFGALVAGEQGRPETRFGTRALLARLA